MIVSFPFNRIFRELVVQDLRQNIEVNLLFMWVFGDLIELEGFSEAGIFILLLLFISKLLIVNHEMPHQCISNQHLANSQSTTPIHVACKFLLDCLVLKILLQILLGS